MNNRNRGTRVFMQAMSILMIIIAILLGIGIDFVDFIFNPMDKLGNIAFWIVFAVSTLLTFIMYFSSSSFSTNKEFSGNMDFIQKNKNIKEINEITGLEHVEEFLDEHYVDKKYERVKRDLEKKLDRYRRKADKMGMDINNPEKNEFKSITWYRWFNGKIRITRLNKKYSKTLAEYENEDLREQLRYRYVKRVYRVTKSYMSDGVKKIDMKSDPDKPTSGAGIHVTKGATKLAISMTVTIFASSIGYELISQGYTHAMWIDMLMKLVSYSISIINGFVFGKIYFDNVHLDFAIKRENLVQKYVQWLKVKYPEAWKRSLINRKEYQENEIRIKAEAEAKFARETEIAKEIETQLRV